MDATSQDPEVMGGELVFAGTRVPVRSLIDQVRKWRRLPDREKFLRRWEVIPLDVAQSMAFEREAVDVASLRSMLARIAPPDTSIQRGAFSPIRR